MAWGITSRAPVNPATASRCMSTERHHEKSGSASRSTFMTLPTTSWLSRIRFPENFPENPGDAIVNPLRQFLQTPFARVEWTVLEVDECGRIERLLMSEAALFAHRHVCPDESGESLDIAESRTGVVGVQSPHRGDQGAALAVGAVTDGALAFVHCLAARRIRVRAGLR